MSNIGSYKNTAFSEGQKFLVLDPATGSTSLVLGSSLIDYITPRLNSVIAESTRLAAENTDYDVGTLIQTSGGTSPGDGLASVYLVVASGEGDFPMTNGNDLLVVTGDDALREQLNNGIVRVDTLSDLQATSGRFSADAAYLMGRTTAGDGGEGEFRWDGSDLSGTLVLASVTSTSVDDTTDTITSAGHGLVDGDGVTVDSTVNGLTANALYWVAGSTTDTFQLSTSFGGAAVDLTGTTNFTTKKLLDPLQGVYVVSDRIGASGGWVRQTSKTGDSRPKINSAWFGYVADWDGASGTNNSPFIQASLNLARSKRESYSGVFCPPGRAAIQQPIRLLQAVDFLGAGTLSGSAGGTEFVCDFGAGVISDPPTDNYTGRIASVFDWTPIFYNTELFTQQEIGGFRINGNDKDVYGLYLNEWFYTKTHPIFIINCNKSPFTGVVGQFNYMNMLTYNSNKSGARFVGCENVLVDCLDSENNLISGGSCLDIIQDISTKSSVKILEWHYEETATDFPDTLARISGRNVEVDGSSLLLSGSNPLRYIDLIGSAGSYTIDGQTFTPVAAIGTSFSRNSFSTSTGTFRLNAGATGAFLTALDVSTIVDNSGNTSNTKKGITKPPEFGRDVRINNSSGGRMMFFSDDNTINFFDNSNRYVRQSGANMEVVNTSGQIILDAQGSILSLKGSGLVDFDASGLNAGRFDDNSLSGNTRLLVYDVDNGTLERVSVGAADSGGAGFKVLRIPN